MKCYPSLGKDTIAAAVMARRLQQLKAAHDGELLALRPDLESLDEIGPAMSGYYAAWFAVIRRQGNLASSGRAPTPADWAEISGLWNSFTALTDVKSDCIARLHVLDATTGLDVLTTQEHIYREHWDRLQNREVLTHIELQELSHRIGGHRNDFNRALRKTRVNLVKNACR